MSREPECRCAMDTDAHTPGHCHWCTCDAIRAAYRRGYNDHARSRAYAEAIYGPYRAKPISESDPLPYSPAGPWPALEVWNQHGKGLENP